MLTLKTYELRASGSNQFGTDANAIEQLRYGFFGEIGGLLSAIKKSKRELGPLQKDSVCEEIGDALWYLCAISVTSKLSLDAVGKGALLDLQRQLTIKNERPDTPLTFSEFDGLLTLCRSKLPETRVELLRSLAAGTGDLFSKQLDETEAAHKLSKLLADLIMVAALSGLEFAKVANENLRKIESRWPPAEASYVPLFDREFPMHEQLPRKLAVHFVERELNGKKFVIQQINGVNIGNRLTDNRSMPDGYRFHDVFHLSYAAHLGWSPVIRALLKYKRKSNPSKDENEDGARAIIIEEGIGTWIFNHASERAYYSEVKEGRLEYALLKQVQSMVQGYEVEICPLWQWERAILCGFEVFRQLRAAGSGVVEIDLLSHKIAFKPLPFHPKRQNDGALASSITEAEE